MKHPSLVLPLLLACAPVLAQQTPETTTTIDAGIAVSQSTLDSYVGRYRIGAGSSLSIWREGSSLFVQADGQAAHALVAESESSFRVAGVQATISFGFLADGSPGFLLLSQGGHQSKAIRE